MSQLQQDVEKWASSQGISVEQFILQAIADRINVLSQQVIEQGDPLFDIRPREELELP